MNKRFMSLLLVLVMVFSLLPISAMASVYLINEDEQTTANAPKVVFHNGTATIGDPQYISSKDATVSDPGVPTLTGRQFFQGWCLKADLSDASMTIDQLNDYIHVEENYNAIKAAGVLNVYAKVVNSYTVTYIAKDADVNADIVKKVDVVPASDAVNYKVSMSYTPTGANQEFRGWKYNNHTYQQGDSLPVTDDIVLNAEVATGHWIKFDDNDKLSDGTNIHASYQKPVLVAHNEGINLSDYAVSASGYEFQGWFTEKTGGTKVESYAAGELKADVTLYAHWNPVDTADYKVIIWKQNISGGKNYDYAEAITLNGTPGSTINTVTQQGTGDNAYAQINGVNKQYTGFHLDHFNQNVTITPQGTAVLNVYYNRNQHTLKFQVYKNYHYGWQTVKEITALYGQPIGSNFPIVGKDETEYRDSRWDPQSSTPYKNVLVYIDTMPDYDVTFHEDTASYSTKTIHYYVEALPGQTADGTYDGKGFIEHKSVDANYNYFTEAEDYIDLVGFSKSDSYPPVAYNDNGTQLKTVWENKSARHVYCFYLRKDYPINYQDGVYVKKVTDNGQTTEQPVDGMTSRGQLDVESGILYESDLASYNANGSKYFAPTFPGYTFAGWFKDPACTQAYTFTTMPVGGITVYAKWIMNRYQVENKETGVTFTVDYHETVGLPAVVKEGMVLVGWFTDEACTHSFNPATRIDDNTTDLDKTVTENGVKGKLTLYAKWRTKLESYINVEYVATNGTALPDTLNYTDQSLACAKPAPTGVTGAQFLYWVVLDAKGNETNIKVYPGQTFTVDAQYAKKDSKPYKLTLKAVYNTSTSETTSLTYDPNGGALAEGVQATVENIPVNGVVTLYGKDAVKDNYLFLGWNHDKTAADNHVVEFRPGQKVGVDKLPVFPNVLYAVWDKIDNHNYVIDFNGKMTIATSATAKKDDTDKNGAFEVAGGNATYQLKADEKDYTNGANLAFNGIDTALINGVPVGSAEGTTASWEKYTVIPANNVYFDDSLVGKSMTAGDGSGYNVKVKDYESSPENGQEKTSLVFTFYGTGIDVYCTTDATAGWIQANVDGTAYPFVNSRYQESEGSTTAIYNTPVISIDGLTAGVEHTLTLRTLTGANYRLDGIRVYNAMQGVGDAATQNAVNEAYAENNEQNATFLEVRDRILAANKFVVDGASDTDIPGTITGAVFLETKAEGATIADYTAKGPKDEVYLAPNQAIAFNLGGWTAGNYKVMVGLSMPKSTDSGTATVYASGRGTSNPITVSARTDMFYEITPDASGNVIIKNNGDGMISVTKLKITTIKDSGADAYTVPAQTTGEPAAEGARGLRVTKSLMAYAMAFNPETEAAPAEPQNPDTPEEPDDPKPGWNDGAFNPMSILKNLFKNLLDGLGKLFGNLPKW